MKVKGMGIKEILRTIWLISANKIKTFESVGKLSSQLKLELNSSFWWITLFLFLFRFPKPFVNQSNVNCW